MSKHGAIESYICLSVVACRWFCSRRSSLVACSSGDGSVGIGSGQSPDPVAPDFAIAYTKGPLFDKDTRSNSAPTCAIRCRFNVGTDLFVRDRASPSAAERNVTIRQTKGTGDVMGVRFRGRQEGAVRDARTVRSERGHDNQPTWAIWEYEIATDTLQRLIAADITAAAGQDMSPYYLPDGRSSSLRLASDRRKRSARRRQAAIRRADENRRQTPLRAARHGRRRQQHAPSVVQPERRFRSDGARPAAGSCSAAGITQAA